LNLRPIGYEPTALTTELWSLKNSSLCHYKQNMLSGQCFF